MSPKFFLGFLGLIVVTSASKSYSNYKVYNVNLKSDVDLQLVNDLQKEYEFWTDHLVVGNDARIMVSPQQDQEFLKYTRNVGLNASLSIADVQELIDAQLKPANVDRSATHGSFSWNQYHTIDEIHAWLDELVEMYPGVVSTVNIGTSHEGRLLKAVVIDFRAGERGANPLIGMIEGGIHAREWISPATVTWIIKEFLTSEDSNVRSMAEAFIWHILPVANPDGYAYTFNGDRMWRKNRNPENFVTCAGNSDLGNGIDLNRNFDYLWLSIGASTNPCTQTYAGPVSASERETQAIMAYVQRLNSAGNMIYYLAFHSYSQMILIPYSHVAGVDVLQVPNYADLFEIAIRGAEALEAVHGTRYSVGTSLEILYAVSGSSFDWAKGSENIPVSLLFELRDLGRTGFLLPTEEIIPNNEEIMACLVEMDRTTRLLGYYSYSGSSSVFASIASLAMSIGLLILMQ